MESEKVTVVADEAEAVAPGFVEAHADRWHGVVSAKLRTPHGSKSFGLEDAIGFWFAAVEKGEGIAAHVGARRRDTTGWRRKKDFEADGFLFGGAIAFGGSDA